MSKVHEELGNSQLSEQFLLYTFGVALICAVVMIIIKKEPVGIPDIGFGILLGVPNYFSCRFLLMALDSVPAVIAFPTFSVSAVVIVTLTGLFAFKEKLSKKQWIALGIILVALVMLNV
jgi:multidrug transporter EmrE-like cation transporter